MRTLAPGTVVTPTVTLKHPLADGGMGTVWVAEHRALATDVAVKYLASDRYACDVARRRFEREAAASAQVQSPHVIRTFDAGVDDTGRPFIVMELLEGETLVQRLERDGPLAIGDVVTIIEQVGAALSSAHALDIVHRDVKPANIFLQRGDDVFCKLLDFGVAKERRVSAIDGLTESGTLIGTLEYMSPEQLMKPDDVDGSADLWALAVTAYCALTKELPFEGGSLGELCVRVLNAELAPPSQHRPTLPHSIDAWFRRALHPKREHRFATATAMAQSLGVAAKGSSVVAAEDPLEPRAHAVVHSGTPRRPWWPVAVILLATVTGALAITQALRDGPTRTPSASAAVPASAPPNDVDASARVDTTVRAHVALPSHRPPASQPRMQPVAPAKPRPKKRRGAAPENPGF